MHFNSAALIPNTEKYESLRLQPNHRSIEDPTVLNLTPLELAWNNTDSSKNWSFRYGPKHFCVHEYIDAIVLQFCDFKMLFLCLSYTTIRSWERHDTFVPDERNPPPHVTMEETIVSRVATIKLERRRLPLETRENQLQDNRWTCKIKLSSRETTGVSHTN